MLPRVSVSNLELFRMWRGNEDLTLEWLLERLTSKEQTEAMKVGQAFHSALENAVTGDADTLYSGEYRFDFNCDYAMPGMLVRELSIEKEYGGLLVRGRVDGLDGISVVDYKTTEQFDPDRLMTGYQWRYYLDMLGYDRFQWIVFVLRQFGPDNCYEIRDVHELAQRSYPGLHADCSRLAGEYLEFATKHLEVTV